MTGWWLGLFAYAGALAAVVALLYAHGEARPPEEVPRDGE